MTSAVGSPVGRASSPPGDGPARVALGAGVWACWTGRTAGDLAPATSADPAVLSARRGAVAPHPWTWLRQVHGSDVVVVDRPGAYAGAEADAAVTAVPGAVVSVLTADCASVALWTGEGVIGAVHAGWRGLAAGVLEHAVEVVRRLGGPEVRARIGPVIGPCCYEFGSGDLDRIADRLGGGVRASTRAGRPALDLRAGVAAALDRVGVALDASDSPCTACGAAHWFSHRARADTGRQALAVWREGA